MILPYNPKELPRELKRHYISATNEEVQEMLKSLGLESIEELFHQIPSSVRPQTDPSLPEELSYEDLQKELVACSEKNNKKISFLGDGLPQYTTAQVVPHVLGIRKLTTAYTPYQPERSQGTLISHWIYQSALSALSGFEAVNASFYDRSTACFEAIKCAMRLRPKASSVLVSRSLYPGDIEVLETMRSFTGLCLEYVDLDPNTGSTNMDQLRKKIQEFSPAAVCFPQISCLGTLEDVDEMTDLTAKYGALSIAVVDPMLMGQLKPPKDFGSLGADMFVGEGQHLAIGPNWGGPGLGIFGIRFHSECKNNIRQTAGRFVGKGKDINGRTAYSVILSTREQHIRREKATSNICSNQAYIATVAGAALLERGGEGVAQIGAIAHGKAKKMAQKLITLSNVNLTYPQVPFFNEFTLTLPMDAKNFIRLGARAGIHVGVDVSSRISNSKGNHLLISFSDMQSQEDCEKLLEFFQKQCCKKPTSTKEEPTSIPRSQFRREKIPLLQVPLPELKKFYTSLGEQNVSPDENIYALGSCTMKYNPYINDYAALLPGFTDLHPQAPVEDTQGALEILYKIQQYFKSIFCLPGVTTQPVAGAQGELVGIKMFQAYHEENGDTRDIIILPRTSHGTNPATATMAGFQQRNIIWVEANRGGEIDMEHFQSLVDTYGKRICGIMVTNPNTSGIFETNFKKIADSIHAVGGLVYMDGANMNAIAGWVDLGKLGVDAVHSNTHKTWTIPHGGGGPGDAVVAVSERLLDYLPGVQVVRKNGYYDLYHPKKSIGSVHRHFGNFAHKVRCYTYLRALGKEGIRRMSGIAVLSACYLYKKLSQVYPTLPQGAKDTPRMHEFILTLEQEVFSRAEAVGLKKSEVIPRVGKLFLDFGLHAPTVAFPESLGLMLEPTESYSKEELDRFCDIVLTIYDLAKKHPEVLKTTPHFTPVDRVDEAYGNRNLQFSEPLHELPQVLCNRFGMDELESMNTIEIMEKILEVHKHSK